MNRMVTYFRYVLYCIVKQLIDPDCRLVGFSFVYEKIYSTE
jgi:hypothetical protein